MSAIDILYRVLFVAYLLSMGIIATCSWSPKLDRAVRALLFFAAVSGILIVALAAAGVA